MPDPETGSTKPGQSFCPKNALEKKYEHWMSTDEVSERLKIPPKTLANWASLGKGPRFARIGRFRRYRLSDLIAWEEALPTRGSNLQEPNGECRKAA
ncbi:helix-turn-helix domain-containing protein [Nocardia sp. 2]|uniref:Helix-turn-helix domain-containing protein n=1 Tax=Nocardia acididurans TaxID=2802282 RepID=A0ABS1MIA7_9NOCA|nr:helix-turn-helix domain-containing protein [Nocardia acididurans]MBL1080306.1 helix-turn-helix domain-containing protein [Nocardia acididurans]